MEYVSAHGWHRMVSQGRARSPSEMLDLGAPFGCLWLSPSGLIHGSGLTTAAFALPESALRSQ